MLNQEISATKLHQNAPNKFVRRISNDDKMTDKIASGMHSLLKTLSDMYRLVAPSKINSHKNHKTNFALNMSSSHCTGYTDRTFSYIIITCL